MAIPDTERSCTGRSAKKVFLKNKKPSLPTAFAPGLSALVFFKKIENNLYRRPFPGALGTSFFQKKTPSLPTALRPSAKTISKTVNLTRR
jgi:hypothetical protein